nr:YbgF trimerization domain-containing protein [Marinicella sp. W31]MDC2877710.1 YbgF trimerization domain-containing protein [Marinicella sp. W31]
MQLEEQIRSLNGQVEDLSFQMLQMEERIRKLQEDMEFRLQDLESGMSAPSAPASSDNGLDNEAASIDNPPPMPDSAMNDATMPGDLPGAAGSGSNDAAFYNVAYNLILSGDYQQAEDAFGEFVLSYPNSPLIPDASFWLGRIDAGPAKIQ